MNQLQSTLAARMTAARTSLAAARADGDDYLVAVREGELDSLTRLAVANDLELDDAPAADAVEPLVLDLTDLNLTDLNLTELEQRETA